MVKRQKEKQYESAREHRHNTSIRNGSLQKRGSAGSIRRLPFDCCALTLNPFTRPVCNRDGIMFETNAILPHLLKHGTDPVLGRKMTSSDLITLEMDKDETNSNTNNGIKWQCPVLNKPFSNHSRIVAIIQNTPKSGNLTANVYSYEAVEELNFKAKNYTDLISGLKFSKATDVLVLQDPNNDELNRKRDINNFHHYKTMRTDHLEKRKSNQDKDNNSNNNSSNSNGDIRYSVTAARIMEQVTQQKKAALASSKKLAESKKRKEEQVKQNKVGDSIDQQKSITDKNNAAATVTTDAISGIYMTSGKCSASLTSSVMTIQSNNDIRNATSEERIQATIAQMRKMKKNTKNKESSKGIGCVQLHTTLGKITCEVYGYIAPKTCMNFIGLVDKGYYDGSAFHRSIKNFMIQGGKPKKTSLGGEGKKKSSGESLWGGSFEDEFDNRLSHDGKGILSMANSGPSTNRSQFFITFNSCAHLDRKHTVFGRVIGTESMEILTCMEQMPTDNKDRPKQEISIVKAEVLVNPVTEAQEAERLRIEERAELTRGVEWKSAIGGSGNKDSVTSGVNVSNSSKIAVGGKVGKRATNSSAGSSRNNGDVAEMSIMMIGKYLPKKCLQPNIIGSSDDSAPKKKKKSKRYRAEMESDVVGVLAATAHRLPPPPKKTVYKNFGGW